MTYTYTLGGGAAVDFNQVASVEPAAHQILERKQCEGGCGGMFYRVRPAMAKDGEKLCPACRGKSLAECAVQAGESWRRRGRPRKAA